MVKRKKKISAKIPRQRATSDQAYNDFTAVLENVYSEIGAFGEALELFQEKTQKHFETINEQLEKLDRRLTNVEMHVNKLSNDIDLIKVEIRMIRHDMNQKVNREEFKMLEERVEKLERELAVR